jgi:serine/threonine protein kinase
MGDKHDQEVSTDGVNAVPSSTTLSPPGGDTNRHASYGLTGVVLFIGVLVVIVVIRRKCRHESEEDEENGISRKGKKKHRIESDLPSEVFQCESRSSPVTCRNYTPLWQERERIWRKMVGETVIDVSTLTLRDQIGKGQFGCVYEGRLARDVRHSNDYGPISHDKVAVKTLKGGSLQPEVIEAFLKEGMLMKDFHHRHVLSLIGVAFGDHGIPMIVLPFMKNGNLKTYIMDPDNKLTVRELLTFGMQVGKGMAYLSSQKFVHRDLATRNCMLDENLLVKVADFGLSRDIYTKEYYSSEDTKAKLPVKWMALESLTKNVYTTKSDVWSYGVLLWELMTRGVTPYPDISNWDVRSYIQSGRRLEQPEACPDVVFELMLRCWTKDPSLRPSFADLVQELRLMLELDTDAMESRPDSIYINMPVEAYCRQMSTSSAASK